MLPFQAVCMWLEFDIVDEFKGFVDDEVVEDVDELAVAVDDDNEETVVAACEEEYDNEEGYDNDVDENMGDLFVVKLIAAIWLSTEDKTEVSAEEEIELDSFLIKFDETIFWFLEFVWKVGCCIPRWFFSNSSKRFQSSSRSFSFNLSLIELNRLI